MTDTRPADEPIVADKTFELFTVGEAATELRCSVATIYRLIRSGEIGYVKVAGSITMFTPEQLQEFLDSHSVRPTRQGLDPERAASGEPGRTRSHAAQPDRSVTASTEPG